MDCLKEFLEKSEKHRIKVCVCGDSVIDEYYTVRVNRISPEFPIPVLLSEDDKPINVVPGGAANVCCQMKHWNTDVYLLTALTKESHPILSKHNFNCDYSVELSNWKMPRKKRLYDGDFPIDRWDIEDKKADLKTAEWSSVRCKLFDNFTRMVKDVKPDMVILSDYGKGIFVTGKDSISSLIIKHCNKEKIPVMVDPKTVSIDLWANCNVIKPNADWAKAFCEKYTHDLHSDIKWESEMEFIAQSLFTQEIALTDSGNGVGIYDRRKEEALFFPSPKLSKRRPIIRSVIGAGDCFCAFFVMAKSLGFDLKDSIYIAFNGSSAYIEDKHNSPVTPYVFQRWFDPIGAKKVELGKLLEIKNQLPKQTWVWTNGCFDIMHVGHLKTFEQAKKLGDKLVVGLNTDESIQALKGTNRPIFPYEQRRELIANLQYVDFVIPIYKNTPQSIIEKLLPDKIVKGGDYKVQEISGSMVVGMDNVHLVPMVNGVSTSKIIERIKDE
jgi:D-beta-D-heptose 7-phosphate kinase/D-beta-D-heptose 1-phosphate adenosyltransferase